MSVTLNEGFNNETWKAASAIPFGHAVVISPSSSFTVVGASNGVAGGAQTYGLVYAATAASANVNVTIQTGGWGRAVAAASLGIGAYVGPGVGTGGLVPLAVSGVASGAPAAAAARFALGVALEAATAGTTFTVSIRPQEVI